MSKRGQNATVLYEGWFHVCGYSAALNQQERARTEAERADAKTMVRARLVGEYDSEGYGTCVVEVCQYDACGAEAWVRCSSAKYEGVENAMLARLALQRARVLRLLETLIPADDARPHSSWIRERLDWEGGE